MISLHFTNYSIFVVSNAPLIITYSIFDILKRENPDYFSVVFDKGGSIDRIEIFEDYKANRDSTPEPILDSVPIIHEILDALGIKTLQLSGYEADDIIGTVAKQAEKEGLKTYMVSPDKDFAQLVSDNIFLYLSLIHI